MESIRNGWKRVGQKDAEIQRSHGGEHRRPSSTVPQILVENVVRNFLQKHQELKNIGLSSGSVQQTKTSDVFPERSTMKLKEVALSESVAAASQPNKKRRYTKTQETQWQIRLEELQEFSQIHGHCRVPKPYPQNSSLGSWVNNMRTEFRKGKEGQQSRLTIELIAELNILGFDWVVGTGNGSDILILAKTLGATLSLTNMSLNNHLILDLKMKMTMTRQMTNKFPMISLTTLNSS